METTASTKAAPEASKPLYAKGLAIFVGWNLGAAIGLTLPTFLLGGLSSGALMGHVVFWAHILSVVLVPAVILLGLLDRAVARNPDVWIKRKRFVYSLLLLGGTCVGAYIMVVRSMLF